jgi:uncharacterized protein YjbK
MGAGIVGNNSRGGSNTYGINTITGERKIKRGELKIREEKSNHSLTFKLPNSEGSQIVES